MYLKTGRRDISQNRATFDLLYAGVGFGVGQRLARKALHVEQKRERTYSKRASVIEIHRACQHNLLNRIDQINAKSCWRRLVL